MSTDRHRVVAQIADQLLAAIRKNDLPGRLPPLLSRICLYMDRVADLAPQFAAEARLVSEVARRYYDDDLWRSEPGGVAQLYLQITTTLIGITRQAERQRRNG